MSEHKATQLETKRLILRQFRPEDTDDYVTVMSEHEVGKWLPKGAGYTRQETERFLQRVASNWSEKEYGIWAVIDKHTGEVYGHCGLNLIDEIGEVEVLYALGANGRGRGFGTEAAGAAIAFAFEVLGLPYVMAVAKADNIPSRRVMEKNGMQYIKDVDLFNQTGLPYYRMDKDAYLAKRSTNHGDLSPLQSVPHPMEQPSEPME
jgi:[ribosomal protein S5]-alanine N-acetyltransferase